MLKRPFCGMAVSFLLGILAAVYGTVWHMGALAVLYLAGALLVFSFAPLRWRRRETICVLFLFLMVCIGWCRYGQEQQKREVYLPHIEDGQQVFVWGKLAKKTYKKEQYIYELSSCYLRQEISPQVEGETKEKTVVPCNRVFVYFASDDYSIGEILSLNGNVNSWNEAVNEGNFDEKSFYESQKIDLRIENPVVTAKAGRADECKEMLYHLKNKLKAVYQNNMPAKEGSVILTMVLGDKTLLDDEIKSLYQATGLMHILSISGLHVSVIGMAIYRLLRKMSFPFTAAGVTAAAFLFLYGTMVGMGTSVFRAEMMFLLMLVSQILGRSYDSLNALGFAALLLLWKNPFLLFYAGFQLSFGAVLGVVCVGRVMETDFKEQPAIKKLGAGVAIQLVTLPIAAWYYYEVPIYAVLVNLLLLPFIGIVLASGILGGAAGLAGVLPLTKLFLFVCQMILSGYEGVCGFVSKLPHAVVITGQPAFWKMVVYYLLLTVFICYRNWQIKKLRSLTGRGKINSREQKNSSEQQNSREQQRCFVQKSIVQKAVRFLLPCGMLFFLFLNPQGGFELDILDVGQGDGSFLRTESGYTIFVDGGSTDVKAVGQYRMLPFLKKKGVAQIDYWFVSHTDADHISGLLELLEAQYPIHTLVFAAQMPRDETSENLCALAGAAGTKVVYVKQGDCIHFGKAKMQAMAPMVTQESEDKNAMSLVLCYEENGFLALFTGDIGSAEEKMLLQDKTLQELIKKEGGLDFYKAAHHGSNASNTEEFLCQLSPVVSSISCAERNRYGHPGAEAVLHMEQAKSSIFYTMESGQIKFTRKRGQLLAQEFKKQWQGSSFSIDKNH